MNVTVSLNHAEVQKLETVVDKTARQLKSELDLLFRNKISTPEQVVDIYKKLETYKFVTGEDYKITFEENTIV